MMKSSIDFEEKYTVENLLSECDDDLSSLTSKISLTETNPDTLPPSKRFFELMQSGIHLEHLMNPSYEILEHLIKGRRHMVHDSADGIHKETMCWANGDRALRRCIVECFGSEDNIKPENIYKLHPEWGYFSDIEFRDELQDAKIDKEKIYHNGIINPLFGKPNPLPLKEKTYEFYLPILITKNEEKTIPLSIQQRYLETTNLTQLENLISSAFNNYQTVVINGDDGYQVGRVANEARQIVLQDEKWKKKNVGFILAKVSVEKENIGWTRLSNSGYYFYSLKPNTKANILDVEIGYLKRSPEKLTTLINHLKSNLEMVNNEEVSVLTFFRNLIGYQGQNNAIDKKPVSPR